MKKAFKIILYVIGSLLIILLLVIGFLLTPPGKDFVRNKAVAFLQKKLKTEVHIGALNYRLPEMVELEEVLLKDQGNDTLLSVGMLKVDISMLKLLGSKVEINKIQLQNGVVNIYRTAPDTFFNFTYITKAFSSPPNPDKKDKPTDTSGHLQLDIRQLVLSGIDVRFNDYSGGNRFAIAVDTLYAGINKIDPYHMNFGLEKLYVNNLRSSFIIDTSYLEKKTDTTTSALPAIAANELNLNNVSFSFQNITDKFFFSTALKKLMVHPKTIDLNKQYIAITDLLLDTTAVKIVMGKKAAIKEEKTTNADTTVKWEVIANTFKINSLDFVMDDDNKIHQKTGIDYGHLFIQNLKLDANKIWYTTDTIAATVNNLSVKEQSGLNLKRLQTTFAYYPSGAYLGNLYLETDNTLLKNFAEIKYPSIAAITTNPSEVELKINLDGSAIGLKDVLLFAPQLKSQPLFKKYGTGRINITAAINGKMNALNIAKFQMQGLGRTYIDLSGKLAGLPDAKKLSYNINIRRLQSNKALLASLLPATLFNQVNPPDNFNITGHVQGTTTNYNTDLLAATSDGNVIIKGTLSIAVKGKEHYDLYVKTDKLNIGKILRKDSLMQSISANITVKGQSFDVNYMNAMLKGEILSAGFMGYNYTNISFDTKVAEKNADVSLTSKDPNAVLSLEGRASFKNKYPALVAKLIIDSADLHALKLSKDELRVHSTIDVDAKELNPDYPNGTIILNKPLIDFKGTRYVLDSMYVSSQPSEDSGNYIIVYADAIQAILSGHTPLSQLGNIVQSHINKHYQKDTAKIAATTPANYDLGFKAVIIDRPLLHVLLPGLRYMDTLKLDGGITPNTLFVNADMPQLQYNDMYLHNAKAKVTEADSALSYSVTLDQFTQKTLQFWYAKVDGKVLNQSISARASIADSAHKERFSLGALYSQDGDTQKISIEDRLKLNYKDWQVGTPNAVVLGKDGLYVQNIRISSGGESISINSEVPQFSAPIAIAINDFMISNITEIISKDTLLANGKLNSKLKVQNIMKAPEATGTLNISDLSVLNDTIGNVDAEIKTANANNADARIAINGHGNDVTITGSYYPQPVNGNNFDLDLHINAIDLHSMEGLAKNQIKNSSGYIRGDFKISGTITAPKIIGELHTDNLQTTVATLGTPFKMPAEKIRFVSDGIVFEDFKIMDPKGNAGTISGKVITTDFNNLQLALKVKAKKLQVLNSTKKDDQLFYGKLLVSSNLNINGTPSTPKLDGSVTVHDSTNFTVAIPKTQAGVEERDGIVEFVNMRDTANRRLLVTKDTVPQYAFHSGAAVNVNLAIQKEAVFNVLIDEGTGDFLSVKGEAALNTAMNPDGSLGITGKYELSKGYYEFNYNLIKRKFEIQPGSSITFSGDPLSADVDITAIYTANIPPYDLVEKQVSDPAQLVYYKQRLPFQVKLKLSGEIMKPAIAFDVVLPDDKSLGVSTDVSSLVQAKLAQVRSNESELNKQVFAVLLLNRFVSDNPFESGTSTSAEFMARQSVSRFLSEQLNEYAKNLIGGFDLSLDLESSEDYSTGQKQNRTDLNVAASKRLLNDRLTVTVGNTFGLEGQSQSKNQNTSIVPGNLAADYQLSRDGRYMVRLYRKNDNTDILEGYVIETGASFVVTMEYNKFKNLFINRKKQLKKMNQQQSKGASN